MSGKKVHSIFFGNVCNRYCFKVGDLGYCRQVVVGDSVLVYCWESWVLVTVEGKMAKPWGRCGRLTVTSKTRPRTKTMRQRLLEVYAGCSISCTARSYLLREVFYENGSGKPRVGTESWFIRGGSNPHRYIWLLSISLWLICLARYSEDAWPAPTKCLWLFLGCGELLILQIHVLGHGYCARKDICRSQILNFWKLLE